MQLLTTQQLVHLQMLMSMIVFHSRPVAYVVSMLCLGLGSGCVIVAVCCLTLHLLVGGHMA